jgi:hypothetical protein
MKSTPRVRTGIAFSALATLGACVSKPPAPQAPPAEVSYDWHALVLVPFGTLLKDSPLALHEVLVFHAAQGGDSGDGDCYAIDGAAPPRFAGQRADDYLLCFVRDRLNRIDATVRLPAQDAGPIFAAACSQWQKNGASSSRIDADLCEGRDGDTSFSARLGGEAAQSSPAQSSPAQSTLTMRISLVRVTP